MPSPAEQRIESHDLTLFEHITSQTSPDDRESLLALQNFARSGKDSYVYLEIGSHLGGSIQPHLVDPKCAHIYSFDPRPAEQPDDRRPGKICVYEGNSTERMMQLLGEIESGDVRKIETFECNASYTLINRIEKQPDLCFIDGEHTRHAVMRDFMFCANVVSNNGVIAMHDIRTLHVALSDIRCILRTAKRPFIDFKLGGSTYVFSFDTNILKTSDALCKLRSRFRYVWWRLLLGKWVRKHLPAPVVDLLRKLMGR
jgi:methyltransferase family protein